jgi:hypothetical protein
MCERFAPAEAQRIPSKFEWHYRQEPGSWLNIAECELSVLMRQCLKGRVPTLEAVEQKSSAWQDRRNEAQVSIDWCFTTDDARIKLGRLYPVAQVQESS